MNVQMSYLILALIIFTLLALSFNQKGNSDLDSRLYHEAVVAVTELGDGFLGELATMTYDEVLNEEQVKDKIKFTNKNNFGPETGETSEDLFDDIDDYHDFVKYDTLDKIGVCTTTVTVAYLDKKNPDIAGTDKEYCKKVTLEITNDYLQDPVKLYFIASY